MSILAKKMALLHNHLETFNFVGAAKIKKNYIFNILDRAILTPLKNSISKHTSDYALLCQYFAFFFNHIDIEIF